jgi:hypothetical protein
VSKRQKTGVWITKFPQKRSDLKPNSPAQAIRRGNSSRQPSFFRILLARVERQRGTAEISPRRGPGSDQQHRCRVAGTWDVKPQTDRCSGWISTFQQRQRPIAWATANMGWSRPLALTSVYVCGCRYPVQRYDTGVLQAPDCQREGPQSSSGRMYEEVADHLECNVEVKAGVEANSAARVVQAQPSGRNTRGSSPSLTDLLRGCTRGRSPLVGGVDNIDVGGTRPPRLSPEGKRERGDQLIPCCHRLKTLDFEYEC